MDDHARTNREAELDPGTEEEEFVPPDQCQSHGHGQPQEGPDGDDTDGHPVGHPPREQGHRSGAAGVTGEREGYQLDIEPILDPVGYPVDAGAALGYPGQGKGQKQFSHCGGPERFLDGPRHFFRNRSGGLSGGPGLDGNPRSAVNLQAYVFRLPPQRYCRKWDGKSHERHRHHDSDGGPTCCVYKHLGDGQEEDATDAQTGGSQGQGQPPFPAGTIWPRGLKS